MATSYKMWSHKICSDKIRDGISQVLVVKNCSYSMQLYVFPSSAGRLNIRPHPLHLLLTGRSLSTLTETYLEKGNGACYPLGWNEISQDNSWKIRCGLSAIGFLIFNPTRLADGTLSIDNSSRIPDAILFWFGCTLPFADKKSLTGTIKTEYNNPTQKLPKSTKLGLTKQSRISCWT